MKYRFISILLVLITSLAFLSCGEEPVPTFTLNTTVSPSEGGVINISPQSPIYNRGDIVTLTPVANEGWVFERWEGNGSGTSNPLQLIMNSNQAVTGVFVRREFSLEINIEGQGNVEERIVSSPSSRQYPFETVVELTPIADEGWEFDGWGGDLTGSANPATIDMDGDKVVTAKFKRRQFNLNISIEGKGSVEERILTSPTSRLLPFETVVELTPVADEGWEFDGWSGDLSGNSNPATLNIDGEKNITAIFKRRQFNLNITIEGQGSVEDRIISNPSARQYPFETGVELSPIPAQGWEFDGWSGDLSGNDNPASLIMDRDKNITATFKRREVSLNIIIEGEGTVTPLTPIYINPPSEGKFFFGENIFINVSPAEGWEFVGWDGDLSGNDNPASLTMDGDKTVTATFKRREVSLNIIIEGEGTVTPLFMPSIIPPSDGKFFFGEELLLRVSPAEGWEFVGWDGDLSGNDNPASLTMDGDKTVTAKFSQIKFYLADNGITCLCPDAEPGEKGFVLGVEFEAVDATMLRERILARHDLSNLCTSLVTEMYSMFENVTEIKGEINGWDMSNVTDMSRAFFNSSINPIIEDWNVSNVEDMSDMFSGSTFNQPIGNWDVGNVTNMNSMFTRSQFNQPIGKWNVSNVTNMGGMFALSLFNHPIGNWDVKNVTNMSIMFFNSKFNQDISYWCVENISTLPLSFSVGSPLLLEFQPKWGTCPER